MKSGKYKKHYKKYLPIYKDLATVNGGNTIWIPTDSHDGWYISSPVTEEDTEAWDKGYPNKSQPSILPDNLSADVERTAYTTITYAPKESYKAKYYKETEYNEENTGYDWMNNDSQRLPDYGDMVAWALYTDIDIKKDYKQRPLPEEQKDIIKKRLKLWVQAFAKMTGDIKHVQLLDSGGGVYVFTPPSVLSPIADRYDKEDRQLIYKEIGSRMRKITGKLNELICNEDESPDEIFSADKVQNKNRQFKTIGAIHKSLDAIVHPIDPENIQIVHKKREDITDEDINVAHDWVDNFTSKEHEDCVDNVVEYLFQGQFTRRENVELESVEGSTWEDILDSWVEEKKKQIERWEVSLEEQENISNEEIQKDITQDKSVLRESIRRLNNDKLKNYIANFVGKDNVYEKSGREMDFFPFWRANTTQSGRSAFYDFYEGGARFTDKADGTSRDIVYWVALEMTYDDENYPNTNIINDPGEKLGAGYWEALQELRNRGENIPVYLEKPNEGQEVEDWKLIKAGKNLGIISESDIIDEEKNKITISAWNNLIETLNEKGIVHNQETKDYIKSYNINPPEEAYQEMYDENDDEFDMSSNNILFNWEGWLMPEFSSNEEFEEFVDKVPDNLVLFRYNDKIKGGPADGILLGSFNSQDGKDIILTNFEFDPISKIDIINSAEDLSINDLSITLDKTKMTVLIKPEQRRS